MSLTTRFSLSIAAAIALRGDLGTIDTKAAAGKTLTLSDGTAADQASKLFADTRTIAASGTDALDLAGVLTDPLGTSLTFTKIKAIVIIAHPGNTNNVVVGGAASFAFSTPFGDATDKINIRPGGAFALFAPDLAGYAVTASTGDILQIANSSSGTEVTYDIVLVGV